MGFVCTHWIPAIVGFAALLCSATSSVYCESIKFTADYENETGQDDPAMQFGLWRRKDFVLNELNGRYFVREKCVDYADNDFVDGPLKTARAMSALAAMLGFFMWIYVAFAPCMMGPYCLPRLSKQAWRIMALVFMTVIACFQGLALLVFKSDLCLDNVLLNQAFYPNECEWDGGSTVAALSTALWFFTGVAMLVCGMPEPSVERPPVETQTVTYQQNVNADGTTTTVTSNVVKGVALD